MSDKKRVIHVNDLVIHADNVIIEPRHHDRSDNSDDRVDPFFGRRRKANEQDESRSHRDEDESPDRRKGFSWF